MPHLLAAPDKFRSTASAREVAEACAKSARTARWSVAERPLSDGGEGFLDAMAHGLDGSEQTSRVTGPLGHLVEAEWLLGAGSDGVMTAVIELAKVCGLELAGGREGNDPVGATTKGCGELLLEAVRVGARRVVIGCGGSATTDGGLGMLNAVGPIHALHDVEIVAATDVTTRFSDAARAFAPQKGADERTVELLTRRLETLAEQYRRDYDVDVEAVDGSGAAGGIAGGLLVLGASIASGFELVAEAVGLEKEIAASDLAITGEGQLDASSLMGKVVGRMMGRTAARVPLIVIAGRVDRSFDVTPVGVEVVSLLATYGEKRALHETTTLISEVVSAHLH